VDSPRPTPGGPDLLRVPVLGTFLRWRHARTLAQVLFLGLATVIILDGLFGPQLAPRNLAGVLPWVHWRGFVVLALLVAGNLFCFACPFMLPRRLAKRILPGDRPWPFPFGSKWLAAGVLVVFFWAYEAFSLWSSPWLTAWVAVTYFALAFVVDGFFRGAAFCKHLCPIGQFHFVNSMVSPAEVRVRDPEVCTSCATKDCIRGRYETTGSGRETGSWNGSPPFDPAGAAGGA
jgi:polyferredoxin